MVQLHEREVYASLIVNCAENVVVRVAATCVDGALVQNKVLVEVFWAAILQGFENNDTCFKFNPGLDGQPVYRFQVL